MTDAMTDKRSQPDESPKKKDKADWVAAQHFNAELHNKDVEFHKGDDIPGNVAQKTIDRWEELGFIRKNT